jgi:hypothetical protein
VYGIRSRDIGLQKRPSRLRSQVKGSHEIPVAMPTFGE